MSENDIALIEASRKLSERNQEHLIAYARNMSKAQIDRKELWLN